MTSAKNSTQITVCWDLETTGFVPNPDARVIEIAYIVVVNDQVLQRRSLLLNHGIPIPEVIVTLTGIDKKPSMKKVWTLHLQ